MQATCMRQTGHCLVLLYVNDLFWCQGTLEGKVPFTYLQTILLLPAPVTSFGNNSSHYNVLFFNVSGAGLKFDRGVSESLGTCIENSPRRKLLLWLSWRYICISSIISTEIGFKS